MPVELQRFNRPDAGSSPVVAAKSGHVAQTVEQVEVSPILVYGPELKIEVYYQNDKREECPRDYMVEERKLCGSNPPSRASLSSRLERKA